PYAILNGSESARIGTRTSCSSDFYRDWREHAEGFNRGRSGSDRQEAIRPGADHHRIDSKPGCGWSALAARDRPRIGASSGFQTWCSLEKHAGRAMCEKACSLVNSSSILRLSSLNGRAGFNV